MAASEAQSTLNGSLEYARDRLAEPMEQVRDALTDFNERASTFIRERPGMCLAAAVGVGFLVGRLVSRR